MTKKSPPLGDLQRAFTEAVRVWTQDQTLQPPPPVTIDGEPFQLAAVARRLWTCRDPVPDATADQLDAWDGLTFSRGDSFAKAARRVIRLLAETERLAAVVTLRSGLPPSPEPSQPASRRGTYRRRR